MLFQFHIPLRKPDKLSELSFSPLTEDFERNLHLFLHKSCKSTRSKEQEIPPFPRGNRIGKDEKWLCLLSFSKAKRRIDI